jgi:uncharacterized protein (TIGR03382 family)
LLATELAVNRYSAAWETMVDLSSRCDLARVVRGAQPASLAVTLAVLAGCQASQASIDLAASEAPITNGTLATGDPNVVALVATGNKTAFCTGTLIAPRVVLTAGHCVASGLADHTQVFFGQDLGAAGTFIDVVHVELAPGFDGATLTNDVALLVLAQPSPEPPKPLSQRPFDPSFVGRPFRIVGFGSTGGANNTFMLKYEGAAAIAEFEDTTFLFHPAPSQTCAGDSGGPAFSTIDAVEVVIGIARSGDPGCVMFARHTRIDPFVASFIAPFIAASAEGAAEAGDPCYYMENCTSKLCMSAPDDPRIRYCSRTCASSADCPLGMSCHDSGSGLACVLPTPTPGALDAGCEVDDDCKDRVCARFDRAQPLECRRPCQGPEDVSCAAGQYCGPTSDEPARYACTLPHGNGGCSAAGGSSSIAAALAMLLAVRRRRRHAEPCTRAR